MRFPPVSLWITLAFATCAPSVWADTVMDAALAGLTSNDPGVRRASVAKVQAWMAAAEGRLAALDKDADPTVFQGLRRELSRYKHIRECRERLAEAVEAAADPATTERFLTDWYRSADTDTPEEPPLEHNSGPGPCVELDFAARGTLHYVVSQRPDVVRRMLVDRRLRFRGALVMELAKVGRPADETLVMGIARSVNPALRAHGISALSHYRTPTAERFILNSTTDPSRQVRASVAWALRTSRDESAFPALLRLLQDPCYLVAESAHAAIGDRKAPELGLAYVQVWTRYPNRGGFLIAGLMQHPRVEAVDPLMARWWAKGRYFELVPQILAEIDHPVARKALVAASKSSDPYRRAKVIVSMDGRTEPFAEELVLGGLSDPDAEVIQVALRVVRSMKLGAAVPVLQEMVRAKRGDPKAVQRALEACLGADGKVHGGLGN